MQKIAKSREYNAPCSKNCPTRVPPVCGIYTSRSLRVRLDQWFPTGEWRLQSGPRTTALNAEKWVWIENGSLKYIAEGSNIQNRYQHCVLHQQNRNTDIFLRSSYYPVKIPIRSLLWSVVTPYCRNTSPLEKVNVGQWCWYYFRVVNICPAVNTYQLKYQQNTIDA